MVLRRRYRSHSAAPTPKSDRRRLPSHAFCSSEMNVSGSQEMSIAAHASSRTAPTQLLSARRAVYAYRRFGRGPGRPLLFLQHFTGTLDNWDPAVVDQLASDREVILFDNAGVGRSSGAVPTTVVEMAAHAVDFLDGLRLE